MFRSLLLLAAVIVIVWFVQRQRNARRQEGRQSSASDKAPGRIQDMVRCTECGIHLPEHEAVQAEGKTFCSTAHRDAWQQREQR
ncbi:MAG: hypothetical protein D6717_00295 [Gammaproteobacteria bacterium]|nr:MAG: hypothetical protein D6717_00295 [Gammaproteobacteria bacterium]